MLILLKTTMIWTTPNKVRINLNNVLHSPWTLSVFLSTVTSSRCFSDRKSTAGAIPWTIAVLHFSNTELRSSGSSLLLCGVSSSYLFGCWVFAAQGWFTSQVERSFHGFFNCLFGKFEIRGTVGDISYVRIVFINDLMHLLIFVLLSLTFSLNCNWRLDLDYWVKKGTAMSGIVASRAIEDAVELGWEADHK